MKPTTPPTKQGVRRTPGIRIESFYQTVNPAYPESHHLKYASKMICDGTWGAPHTRKRKVAVVSLEPENIDALVEAGAKALVKWERNRYGRVMTGLHVHPMQAAAVVRALLGLPLPKGRGRG